MVNKLMFNMEKKVAAANRLISVCSTAGKAPCLTTNPWDLKAWQRNECQTALRVSCSDGP